MGRKSPLGRKWVTLAIVGSHSTLEVWGSSTRCYVHESVSRRLCQTLGEVYRLKDSRPISIETRATGSERLDLEANRYSKMGTSNVSFETYFRLAAIASTL